MTGGLTQIWTHNETEAVINGESTIQTLRTLLDVLRMPLETPTVSEQLALNSIASGWHLECLLMTTQLKLRYWQVELASMMQPLRMLTPTPNNHSWQNPYPTIAPNQAQDLEGISMSNWLQLPSSHGSQMSSSNSCINMPCHSLDPEHSNNNHFDCKIQCVDVIIRAIFVWIPNIIYLKDVGILNSSEPETCADTKIQVYTTQSINYTTMLLALYVYILILNFLRNICCDLGSRLHPPPGLYSFHCHDKAGRFDCAYIWTLMHSSTHMTLPGSEITLGTPPSYTYPAGL